MTLYCTDDDAADALPEYDPAVAAELARMGRLRERASRRVDRFLGSPPFGSEWFPTPGGSPSARTFYGSGTRYLWIGGFTEGEVASEDVVLPSGHTAPAFALQGEWLVTTDSTGVLYPDEARGWFSTAVWAHGVPVTITRTWGYATVPGDIVEATVLLVVASWRQRDADPELGGDVGKSFAMPEEAARILRARQNTFALVGAA